MLSCLLLRLIRWFELLGHRDDPAVDGGGGAPGDLYHHRSPPSVHMSTTSPPAMRLRTWSGVIMAAPFDLTAIFHCTA